MGAQSRHPWKTRMMLLFAVLVLVVGFQAAPQHYPKSSYHQPRSPYQPKCWYEAQPQECTTVYENVERKVSNVECHTEYGKKTCKNQDKYVTVRDTEKKCERKAQAKCNGLLVPHEVCENKPHEVCRNVLTKKTDKYPSHLNCKTVQKKVCY